MALVKRLVKGSPLTFAEGDANLDYLENLAGNSTTFNNWTGSNTSQFSGTSSYAATASLAPNYVLNSATSSFIINSQTSSFVFNSQTSSMTVATASYVTSSAVNGTVTSASYALTASHALNGGTATLASSLLTNITVGGLTSGTSYTIGTTLESIFRTMLVTYIPPTLSSLTIRSGGSTISTDARDVNNSFTFNTASFSATADNPTSIFPLSSSFTSSGADIGTITQYFGNNVLSSTNTRSVGANYTVNRATTDGSVTFTVRGKRSDTLAFITDAATSIYFGFRNYLAASATIISDNNTAQSVINNGTVDSIITTDKIWETTCGSANQDNTKFTYIIFPASYGDLTGVIQNDVNAVLGAFNKLGDYTITNAYSATISVRVYKSSAQGAFDLGDTLNIS